QLARMELALRSVSWTTSRRRRRYRYRLLLPTLALGGAGLFAMWVVPRYRQRPVKDPTSVVAPRQEWQRILDQAGGRALREGSGLAEPASQSELRVALHFGRLLAGTANRTLIVEGDGFRVRLAADSRAEITYDGGQLRVAGFSGRTKVEWLETGAS